MVGKAGFCTVLGLVSLLWATAASPASPLKISEAVPPETVINTFPANPSNDPSPTFRFASVPDEPGVEFECELDGDGSFATALDCDGGVAAFLGLGDGQHTFRVRAIGDAGADSSPATRTWTVDTQTPETNIEETPPDPNSGFSVAFRFSSSESFSSFRCQLDGQPLGGQVCGTSAGSGSRSYFNLGDGSHAFRVWAIDNAGNVDPTAAESRFVVETSIGDVTPPDTAIVSVPENPARSSSASFAYSSSEWGSRFECRLDGAAFTACPADRIVYGGLRNGNHRFEVRAVDRAGKVDSVPAVYAWVVAATAPVLRFTDAPGGSVRAKKGKADVRFAFASSEAGSSFRCRLDLRGSFEPCTSPYRFEARTGRHVFEVFAIDRLGNQGASAFRIFRVSGGGEGPAFFARHGRFLSSLSAELSPTRLPRDGLRPISLFLASTFENLDGSDIPPLRTMTLRLAPGGLVQTRGLPRCSKSMLLQRSTEGAMRVCGSAQVGSGIVNTAIRFPEGVRVRGRARLLLFNAGRSILMHIHTTVPFAGTFVIPISIRQRGGGSGAVLHARIPRIAADFGQLTGFSMKLERVYTFRGRRHGYLMAGCPIPEKSGLDRLFFELADVEYRFQGGLRMRNSSFSVCRATR